MIKAHRLSEIDTPAFREFLTKAVASFQDALKRMQTKPEDVMPWKVNGERWHLGDKGFAPGRKIKWERSLLARVVEFVRSVEPTVEIELSGRIVDKNGKVIASRVFEERQKFDKLEPSAAVTAFGDAFGRLAKDMIGWTMQAL